MSSDCVFCKILAGEVPSSAVYEDDHVVAFLDIAPIIKGHVLVIPKNHVESIHDITEDELAKVMHGVKKVAAAQVSALGAEGINVTQANGAVAGQVVPHIHFHVIPRYAEDGHHWNWNAKPYDTPEEMTAIRERLAASVES